MTMQNGLTHIFFRRLNIKDELQMLFAQSYLFKIYLKGDLSMNWCKWHCSYEHHLTLRGVEQFVSEDRSWHGVPGHTEAGVPLV